MVFRTGPTLTLYFLFVCCSTVQSGDGKSAILDRFNTQAPLAWKLVDAADESPGVMKVNTKIVRFYSDKLSKTRVKVAVVRRKAGCFTFEARDAKGISFCYAHNPHYSFDIARESENAAWQLEKVASHSSKNSIGQSSPELVGYIKPNGYCHVLTLGLCSEMVNHKSFKAERAEEVDGGLVRVHFDTLIPLPQRELPVQGWMDFDPGNSWVLCRSKYQVAGDTTVSVMKSFSPITRKGFRPCESWEEISTEPEHNLKTTENAHFVIENQTTPDEAVFRLSHYGLPEPADAPALPHPVAWYIWFGVGGLGCVIAGYLMRKAVLAYRKRQEAKA